MIRNVSLRNGLEGCVLSLPVASESVDNIGGILALGCSTVRILSHIILAVAAEADIGAVYDFIMQNHTVKNKSSFFKVNAKNLKQNKSISILSRLLRI